MAKGRRGFGKKKIEKLVPVKKTVTKDGDTHQQTYYVDPFKDKSDGKKRTKKGEDVPSTKSKKDADTSRTKPKQEEDGSTRSIRKDSDKASRKDSKKSKLKPDDTNPFKGMKDFEDFGKVGIDPESAEQFLCNM